MVFCGISVDTLLAMVVYSDVLSIDVFSLVARVRSELLLSSTVDVDVALKCVVVCESELIKLEDSSGCVDKLGSSEKVVTGVLVSIIVVVCSSLLSVVVASVVGIERLCDVADDAVVVVDCPDMSASTIVVVTCSDVEVLGVVIKVVSM